MTGLILAGGRARRLGGRDKGLLPFRGRPLVEWVIAALHPQVGRLLINANRNLERYAACGHPVVADQLPDFQGPLAGILSAMAVAETPWMLTVPCDNPFPPPDLARRLAAALTAETAELAVAGDATRVQPAYALLPVILAPDLRAFLDAGERRLERWQAGHRLARVDFRDGPDAFANINTLADGQRLETGSGVPR